MTYRALKKNKVHGLKIDPKWTDIILTCPPVKTKFAKQTGGGVESFGNFYETQLARMTRCCVRSVWDQGRTTTCWTITKAKG